MRATNPAAMGLNHSETVHPSRRLSLSLGSGQGRPPIALGRFLATVEALNARRVAPSLAELKTIAPDYNWHGMKSKISALKRAGLIGYVPSSAPPYANAFVVAQHFQDFRLPPGEQHIQAIARVRSLIARYRKAAKENPNG